MLQKILLLVLIGFTLPTAAHEYNITIVPYPREIVLDKDNYFTLPNDYRVKSDKQFSPARDLLIDELALLTSINGTSGSYRSDILLKRDSSLDEEEYRMVVDSDKITISAATYNSMVMGVTSLLQMVDTMSRKIPCCTINDKPHYGYRTFMLDVARQWTEMSTIKQCIDLCRWYKIRYLQLHLSDDALFTFSPKSYPQLPSVNRSYSRDELRDLVEYAKLRGVAIIPELDLPGHSTAMRAAMPELFGKYEWGVIDFVNEQACQAVEQITKEIIDIFYTSPYFHIGADEANLNAYAELEHVKQAVIDKGFDNVHDLYLEYVVRMHRFVQRCGKETIVWESFKDKGSRHVVIPNDLIVIAWETYYQTPQSLLANDYTIINAAWKPRYVCPGFRWSPQYIYESNLHRWENQWVEAPSYKSPIQLDSDEPIMGGQLCAWEMADPDFVISLHARIPAMSETAWNDVNKQSFEDYNSRFKAVDSKIMRLLFPVKEQRDGFKAECNHALNDNRINYFGDVATVKLQPLHDGEYITYTTNGEMPTSNSKRLTEAITLTDSEQIKYGVYNSNGDIVGYRSVRYILEPIDVTHVGELLPVRDRDIVNVKEIFNSEISVVMKSSKTSGNIHYTTDGTAPTTNSPQYTQPIKLKSSTTLRAQYFENTEPVGCEYHCEYLTNIN